MICTAFVKIKYVSKQCNIILSLVEQTSVNIYTVIILSWFCLQKTERK